MHELKLHTSYCESFNVSLADIHATEEHQGTNPLTPVPLLALSHPVPQNVFVASHPHAACTAYTRYVLDVGSTSDWLGLQMALAPCLLGYGAVAKMLHVHDDTKREDNTYWAWIENYNAEDYVEAVKLGSGKFLPPGL